MSKWYLLELHGKDIASIAEMWLGDNAQGRYKTSWYRYDQRKPKNPKFSPYVTMCRIKLKSHHDAVMIKLVFSNEIQNKIVRPTARSFMINAPFIDQTSPVNAFFKSTPKELYTARRQIHKEHKKSVNDMKHLVRIMEDAGDE